MRQIIIRPIVTEKMTAQGESEGRYGFVVDKKSNKVQIKQAVVGNGHAKKEQVQEMVRRLLSLPAVPGADAADALACAICHAHGGMGLGSLETAGYRMRRGRLV